MFKLFRFLKGRDLALAIVSIILILIQSVADITLTFLIANLLDLISSNTNSGALPQQFWNLVGIMAGCVIISVIFQGIGVVTSARVGVRLANNVRFNAFKKIQTLTFKEIDTLTTPSLITRLSNDVLYYQNAVILSIRMAFRSIFLVIGGVIATFVIGAKLDLAWIGAIFFAIILTVSLAIFLILKKAVPIYRKQQKGMDQINWVMRENLLGVRVVKAFNLQKDQIEKFDNKNSSFAKIATTANRWSTSIIPIIYFLVQTATVIVIMCLAKVSSNQNINYQVTFILQIIQLTSMVSMGFVLASTVLIMLSYTKASCDRINQIFDTNPSILRCESNNFISNSQVVFNNVSYKYNSASDAENALSQISFVANPGEMIGIIGPTGSGKTTLVNLITRTLEATEGNIQISGFDVKEINYESLRDAIGVSPQKSVILSGTIASNLRFGKIDATDEEMLEAANQSQAIEFINMKENKFNYEIEQRGTNLSGGQKQRLSIARALIKKPKILILDDSTSALDMITEAKVQDNIRKLENTTTFLVGQRISAISRADKIIVLDQGKMVGFGDHSELLKNCELYRDISVSQGVSE
ncbi:MAG: ABC transporter ATP-binding protein [Malacoplasma sp.]|nr:ABC transporter ATP-binding protein [Malacoplasma sp.]